MLRSVLGWAEWSDVKELLSPAFFRVMPVGRIGGLLREMYGNYRDEEGYRVARERVGALLERSGAGVRPGNVGDGDGGIGAVTGEEARKAWGDALLRLYFLQLFGVSEAVVDLRPERFRGEEGELVWDPAALWVRWDEEFLEALRGVYGSYYGGSDEEFEAAVARLGLPGMSELFRAHFGSGDQREVVFDGEHFRETFREILGRCKEEGLDLHRHFGVLGFYLASLYDHLEGLGGSYDVRSAVQWALEKSQA